MATAAAKLGISVDSSDLKEAVAALKKLTQDSAMAQNASSALGKTMKASSKLFAASVAGMTRGIEALVLSTKSASKEQMKAATNAREFADSIYKASLAEKQMVANTNNATNALRKQTNALKQAAVAATVANDNRGSTAKATSRFYVGNIAAQFQDIGVTAAMGMSPMMIALQQGTQLSEVLKSMENPLIGLKEAFKSLLGPISLVTIGLTAALVVGIQYVDWAKTAQYSVGLLADAMLYVSKNMETFSVILAGLSIVGVSLAVTSLGVSFTALGASIIVATKAIVAFTASLALRTIALFANPIGIASVAIVALAVAFSDATTTGEKFRFMLSFVYETANKVIGSVAALSAGISGLMMTFKGMKFSDVKASMKDAFNADYLSNFSKGLETLSAKTRNLFKTDLKTDEKNPWADLMGDAQQRLRALGQERQSFYLYGEEAAIAAARTDLFNQAQQKGINLSPTMKTNLESTAVAIGQQTWELDKARTAFQATTSIATGFFTDIKNGLKEGAGLWETFGNAVENVLDRVLDMMIQIGVQMSVSGMFGHFGWYQPTPSGVGGTNALSGWNASQGTLAIPSVAAAKGGTFTNGVYNSPTMFTFAKGGQFGLMGEAGPEAVMPLSRSPDGSLGVRLNGGGNSSSNPVVVNVINNANANARTEERQTSQGIEIDVIIDQIVSQKLTEQGSDSNRALNAYNSRRLVSR